MRLRSLRGFICPLPISKLWCEMTVLTGLKASRSGLISHKMITWRQEGLFGG